MPRFPSSLQSLGSGGIQVNSWLTLFSHSVTSGYHSFCSSSSVSRKLTTFYDFAGVQRNWRPVSIDCVYSLGRGVCLSSYNRALIITYRRGNLYYDTATIFSPCMFKGFSCFNALHICSIDFRVTSSLWLFNLKRHTIYYFILKRLTGNSLSCKPIWLVIVSCCPTILQRPTTREAAGKYLEFTRTS